MAGYRVLAINRGEKEKFLTVKLEAPEDRILGYLRKQIMVRENPQTSEFLEKVIEDSYRRLIAPAVEREIRNALTEQAEDGAIQVFGKNLEQLLMQPPIAGQVVLGWDPAFRTGCKLQGMSKNPVWSFEEGSISAGLSQRETGAYLDFTIPPQDASKKLSLMILKE